MKLTDKSRAILLALYIAFGTLAGCGMMDPPVKYEFIFNDAGTDFYSMCVDGRCTVVPESEVPEQHRRGVK